MNRIALAALALAAAAVATPAAAETGGVVYNGNKSVALTLQGDVSPRCGIVKAPGQAVDLKSLKGQGAARLAFEIDCNEPVAYTLVSANGALANVDLKGEAPRGFAGKVAYSATVEAPKAGFSGVTHDSQSLMGAGQSRAGTGVPFKSAFAVKLAWNAAAPLLAGRYQDVLTLRIAGGI